MALTVQPANGVTVEDIPNPGADDGCTVHDAWKLTATQGTLAGRRVTVLGPSSSSFYIGCDPSIPLPDSIGWEELETDPGPGGTRTAKINTEPCNPSYVVLATAP